MMIKVLLVDDEFLVCSFLKGILVWEDYGYTIAGQASNGRQAMEMVEQLHPDLILLDVSMPEMDGIEFIRLLHRKSPQIKVIMLSSYSDYDYVRETMKLGATDYLLKHQLNRDDLIKLLAELKFSQSEQKPLPESPVTTDGYSFSILRDSRTRSFFEKKHHEVPAPFRTMSNPMPVVAKIKLSIVDSSDRQVLEKQESFIHSLLSTCAQICSQEYQAKAAYLGNYEIVFLFPASSGEAEGMQAQRVGRCMNVIHDAVLKYHNTYLEWKQGNRCVEVAQIPDEYATVYERFGKDRAQDPVLPSCQLSIEQERQLIIGVMGKDKAAIHRVLTGIFTPLMDQRVHSTEISLLSGDILTLAVKLYKQNQIPFCSSEDYGVLNSNLEKAYLYFEGLFIALIDSLAQAEQYSKTVTAVIKYVEEHYQEDISLYDIGTHCSMNSSYISSVFKKETGTSLVQYINRMRIYTAGKLMLMEGSSPTQVYEQAGFHNYNNFFNLFKSITGMTPTNFKKEATVEWISRFSPL